MGVKVTKLNDEQFKNLGTTDEWKINEVPLKFWDTIPNVERLHDTFCIMASGSRTEGTLNGYSAIAGFDVLALETKRKKNEPEGNAYHYVIQKREDGNYLIGPFRADMVVPHWFDAEDLSKYWMNDG
jgi:hypothetical protein